VWRNLFLIFDCPSSVYTAHDHDLFRTLSKWISVDIKIILLTGFRAEQIIYLGFVPFGGYWAKRFFCKLQ
jgi:hypothetical protein